MRMLDRKLLRDLRHIWVQCLAIALVLSCGIMVLILSSGTQRSLEATRTAYYENNRFADVFASLTRAPRGLLSEISRIDGVARAEGRVVFTAMLDLDGKAEPASALVISVPSGGVPILNVPVVRHGRMPRPEHLEEVAVSEAFAEANGLRPGDRFRAVLNGQMRPLTIAGVVISPEYIYTVGSGAMEPDDENFGILWMGERAAAGAMDLSGAFNDVTLTLARGADDRAVIAALDRILAPYGGTGAYGRDRQPSNVFIEGELKQLGTMAAVLPPIFLLVSAVLVNMVLGRLVALDRGQIGLFKALGYRTHAISAHYGKMTVGIGIVGVLLGWAVGWWLGHELTGIYTRYFRFPSLMYRPGTAPIAISGVLGLAATFLGGLRAVRAATRLPPAVAMSPAAPPIYRRGWLDRLGRGLRFRQTTMMILRSLVRWPGRAAVTLFGVGGSVAVLVASFFTFDAIDLILEELFERANRQDATIALARPVNAAAELDALALPGVIKAEGLYAAPVRLVKGTQSRLVSLQGRTPEAGLSRLLDADGEVVDVPLTGLALSAGLADGLGARPGDRLRVDLLSASRGSWEIPVTAVIRQSLGQDAYMNRDAFFRLIGQGPQVNMLHLAIDRKDLSDLQARAKQTPAIARFTLWSDIRRQFEDTLDESLVTMTVIFASLGMLITIGVVYNAARIQMAERAYELASLRVLGFRRREVAYVLVAEQMVLTLIAVPVGWLVGYGFCTLMAEGFSTEVVSIPVVVTRRTYAVAALIVILTALASVLVVRRRLDRIDIVSALKQKE
ncbi:ABC transporter permease [Mameliella sp. AT18]|uniref:ABC transporter permease n=1 Tax=Mameliella sp. AT18 TaxID=3028385 RepID=UPI00237A736B|nr:ABC transporter permease [Mameliella sp. AT18]MDD9731276.1 ABC transporter permease [Mameliella sp. AT18]